MAHQQKFLRILAPLLLALVATAVSQEEEPSLPPLSAEEEELFELEIGREEALAPVPVLRDSMDVSWADSLFGHEAGDSLYEMMGETPSARRSFSGEAWPLYPERQLPFAEETLQDILRRAPLAEEETQRWKEIFRADSTLALSMVQIREEAWPCYYPYSDLWVYIWRGWGQLILGEREMDYSPGAFYQVPAGTIHAFRNISGAPTVALVWQSPPIDSLRVEIIPEEILAEMRADSLRLRDLEERSLYRGRH